MFHIFDDDVLRNPSDFMRVPVPHADEDVRFLISGDTWEELVSAIAAHLARFRSHTAASSSPPTFSAI